MDELQQALDKLDNLEGLDTVKKSVHNLTAQIRVTNLRKEHGFPTPQMAYRMLFLGTNQTEAVAGIIGDILHALGVLSVGHLVTVNKEDLISEYIGQTSVKTQEVIERAMGGVLLIKDTHMFNDSMSRYGNAEALSILYRALVEVREDLVIIFAGEKEKLNDFLNANPGLAAKFRNRIDFDD